MSGVRFGLWIVTLLLAADGCSLAAKGAKGHREIEGEDFKSGSAVISRENLGPILGAICPGEEKLGGLGGCKKCLVDLDVRDAPPPMDEMTVRTAIFGHFVSGASDDLFLATSGCEDHATGFGGSLILTHSEGGWKIARKYKAGDVGDCMKISARNGREGLLCHWTDGHFGQEEEGYYYQSADDLMKSGRGIALASRLDNLDDNCGGITSYDTAISSEFSAVKLNRQGTAFSGLNFDIKCSRWRPPAISNDQCDQIIVGAEADKVKSLGGPPPADYLISYVFDGETFKLSPESEQKKRGLDDCSKAPSTEPGAPSSQSELSSGGESLSPL